MESIIEFITQIGNFFSSEIYVFVQDVYAQYLIWTTAAKLQFYLYAITFAWGVAEQVIDNLQLADAVLNYFNQIPAEIRSTLIYFKFPTAINIVFNASVSKFVMKQMGLK